MAQGLRLNQALRVCLEQVIAPTARKGMITYYICMVSSSCEGFNKHTLMFEVMLLKCDLKLFFFRFHVTVFCMEI